MTELRDARLRRALDAAPDAELRPLPSTREAIRAAAQSAAVPWWGRWRWSAGGGVPWSAALATVALATLVTVLWQREEVPGLHDTPIPPGRAPQVAPLRKASPPPVVPATVTTVPAPAEPSAPRAAVAQAPAAPATGLAAPAPVLAQSPAPAAPSAAEAAAPAPAPAPPEARAPAAAPPPPAAPLPARNEDQARAAPAAPQAAERAAKTAQGAGAVAVPAPAARLAAPRDTRPGPAAGWTDLTVEGREGRFSRADQPALRAAVEAVLASPGVTVPRQPSPEGALRLTLMQGSTLLGVLEWTGDAWLWRPGAGEVQRLQAAPAAAQALRDEVARVMGGR